MQKQIKVVAILFLGIVFFSACNNVPDHTKYIPKDAILVAGVNFKGLSKKIAWNVITGSKLFKEMQKRLPEKNANDALSGIEKSGIDFISTVYAFVNTDKRMRGGNRVTVLVPLSNSGDWETYLKKVYPNVKITSHGDRKEAKVNDFMYLGWNKHLMAVTNLMNKNSDYDAPDNADASKSDADITMEMDNIFNIKEENSIISNINFKALQSNGHDVTFWLNYDQLLTQYNNDLNNKMPVSLAKVNLLWKDAAIACGFDFNTGKITGDMKYYVSKEMYDISRDFGAVNVDKEMLERLPNQNMDLLMAMHISPTGIKKSVDKTEATSMIDATLTPLNMNLDYILSAFSGDMAFVMNDISVTSENFKDEMGREMPFKTQKTNISMTYALKFDKKDNFTKLFAFVTNLGMGLKPFGNNGYCFPIDSKDSVYILMNDKYAVASNKFNNANGFLNGNFRATKMPDAASSQIIGHPIAFYLDVQEMAKNIDPNISESEKDKAMIMESKKLLTNIAFTGGAFNDNATTFHLDINFANKEENSIIALMDYGMRLSDAETKNK